MTEPRAQDGALAARLEADAATMSRSLGRLRQVGELRDLDADTLRGSEDLLVRAITQIGRIEGFDIDPAEARFTHDPNPVSRIARAARLGIRQVAVDGRGVGRGSKPILVFAQATTGAEGADARPMVLLPAAGRGPARVWDPDGEVDRAVDRVALQPLGIEFYPTLDGEGALTYRQVARFTFARSRREMITILLVAFGVGMLGLLTPITTRYVFGTIVPERESGMLWAAGGALALAAIVVWAFTIVQGFAVTRLSLRAEQRLQPAVWARVLSLPASFFREFSSGELAGRVLGADQLRRTVSTSTVGVALTALFSMVNLIVMYAYSVQLGIAGTVVLAVAVGATGLYARRLVVQTAEIITQYRANNAHITDILQGLSVIRTAAAERRFFALHAELIRRKTVLQAQQQRTAIGLQAFYAGLTTAAPALFIATVAIWGWNGDADVSEVSGAVYVAFVTAFGAVLGSLLALSTLIQPLAAAPPTLQAMRPIFEIAPEYDENRRDVGVLQGRVELRNVSFRYSAESRWVAREMNLVAEPGQFVALVGPSGAGKSTIMRLLLGFETPSSGNVLYDAHHLREVDVASVRSQLGVVLQDAQPIGGSIFDNVAGARSVDSDAVWDALDAAGLGDEVRAMPMNLHTHVAPDGSTLSGGQLQRLLIARALVTQPRVMLLDEATSHLDDETQTVVTESVARLGITRIVIAHRLSTIRAADKICVLNRGAVVEEGTYDELIELGGEFQALATRQLV